jgi:thiol-disulfide isomerase/thioredoxin
MKKILPLLGMFAMGSTAFAQLPVSTATENKKVVLEEFTGIYCTFCPDGHLRAQQLANNNPGNVVLVNIHSGGFSAPQAGDPDYRTSFGTALDNQSQLTGYPAGTVNRRVFSQAMTPGGTALGRGDWASNANTILGETSYVNVALESSVDAVTRVMTVDVELYFSGATAPGSVNLNVALLQSNIEGPQTGSSANPSQVLPNGNYQHNHMLRHLLTGQWGEVISTTTQGTTVSRQYTYTLPANINNVALELGDLEIVAFVVEGQQNVISGNVGPIVYTNLQSNNAAAENLSTPAEICGNSVDASFVLKNKGMSNITSAVISYSFAGQTPQTMNWNGNLGTFESEIVNINNITVPSGGGVLTINVTSINGGADDAPADNIVTRNVAITSNSGQGVDYVLTMVQDRYGDEITWTVKNENGVTIASGGPYALLSANGTQTHTHNFSVSSTGCFEFEVLDDYGDGINAGYGAGNYNLKTAVGATVFSSNGQYGASEQKPFEVTSLAVSVNEVNVSEFNVYPNPASDNTFIEFVADNGENMTMTVMNALGEVVMSNFNVANGFNRINVNCSELPNGFYMIQLTENGHSIMKKFNVIK